MATTKDLLYDLRRRHYTAEGIRLYLEQIEAPRRAQARARRAERQARMDLQTAVLFGRTFGGTKEVT